MEWELQDIGLDRRIFEAESSRGASVADVSALLDEMFDCFRTRVVSSYGGSGATSVFFMIDAVESRVFLLIGSREVGLEGQCDGCIVYCPGIEASLPPLSDGPDGTLSFESAVDELKSMFVDGVQRRLAERLNREFGRFSSLSLVVVDASDPETPGREVWLRAD